MNDLERRALLGDTKAQRECTDRKIVLPCPHCGGEAEIFSADMDAPYAHTEYQVMCKSCFASSWLDRSKRFSLQEWNTRPAPPIGRCGACTHLKDDRGVCLYCEVFNMTTPGPEAFCSAFEPKGGEYDG